MSRRRVLFNLVFFLGTALAALGWYAEWRLMISVNMIIIAGHVMQIIGLFGFILVPDAIVRIKDAHEEEYDEIKDIRE